MDEDDLATATTAAVRNTTCDYSPDDDDLDETAEATRDTLADGLVTQLLRPCVDRLDASVQCTRLSQLNLKLQLDSLATELKRLSLLQHDYLCIATSMLPSEISASASKTVSPISTVTKTATDTCILLDGYARRLCSARSKIAVVGNILESTQERLRALSHRIGREHNNRRSLLEPQVVVSSTTETDKEEIKHQLQDQDQENNKHEQSINDALGIQATSEPPKL